MCVCAIIYTIIWWNQIYVINYYDWHSPHFSMFHWPVMAWWLFKNSQNVPALPGSWLFTNPGLRVSACGFRCRNCRNVCAVLWGLSWVSLCISDWFSSSISWACTRGTILASCFPEPSPNLNDVWGCTRWGPDGEKNMSGKIWKNTQQCTCREGRKAYQVRLGTGFRGQEFKKWTERRLRLHGGPQPLSKT